MCRNSFSTDGRIQTRSRSYTFQRSRDSDPRGNRHGKYGRRRLQVLRKEGQKVNAGDKLLQFDSEKIKAHGYETTCIFVVTNGDEYPDMKLHTGMDAVQGETVIGGVLGIKSDRRYKD